MAVAKKDSEKKPYKVRIDVLGIIYIVVCVLCLIVVVRIIDLQFIHKPSRENFGNTFRYDVIDGKRGDILARDGRFLAVSTPLYEIDMDPTVSDKDTFDRYIGALSADLAAIYGDKTAEEYRAQITEARTENKKHIKLGNRLVSHQEKQKIQEFPIFSQGRFKGGFKTEKKERRIYPYNTLGRRVLGYSLDNAEKTKVGLEMCYDYVLAGKPGKRPMMRTEHSEWIQDLEQPETPPEDGLDVQTTIDVDIQDIADRALRNQLAKSDQLQGGCVVVMETATGAIRAMVNLQKYNGDYSERINYAINRKGEPGSVFKLATLIALIELKGIKLDNEIKAMPHWTYGGHDFEDHYLNAYNMISVIRGFEISSNNVFRILAATNFGDNPQEYLNKLNDEKINYNFPFDLAGMEKAYLKSANDPSWSPTDLPQIAMGYTVELTPLHTLNFYNAVANGGKMMKPYLVSAFLKDGKVVKEFKPETISVICQKSTVDTVKRALRGVVLNGTGRLVFNGCKVHISGKTGTAQIVDPETGQYVDRNGMKQHQATFVGYFPSENPKYTMICICYSEKTAGNFYGATWGGPVFREVAEKIYASSPEWEKPVPDMGLKGAGLDKVRNLAPKDTSSRAGVPYVVGMGLKDASFILENRGYSVKFTGAGKVASQSSSADSTGSKEVFLTLTGANVPIVEARDSADTAKVAKPKEEPKKAAVKKAEEKKAAGKKPAARKETKTNTKTKPKNAAKKTA